MSDKIRMLRTCGPNGEAYEGKFRWPLEVGAVVTAPDWNERAECGGGLHGLVDGLGDWGLMDWSIDAKAMIVCADRVIELNGKVKAPSVTIQEIGRLPALLCRIVCDPKRITALIEELKNDAASGYASKLAASGDASKLAASGDASVVVSAGHDAVASAGADGAIALAYYDGKRNRIAVGYVGEDGIESGVFYRADRGTGKLVKA